MEKDEKIQEVIVKLADNIVNRQKSRNSFLITFLISLIILFIARPSLVDLINSQNSSSVTAYLLLCGLVSLTFMSLILSLVPAKFAFKNKPNELIGVVDKAIQEYLVEIKLLRFRYLNSIEELRYKPFSNESNARIVKMEADVLSIDKHLKIFHEKQGEIRIQARDLIIRRGMHLAKCS